MPAEYEALVDKLKNKRGVDNPYALAHYIQNKRGKSATLTTAKIESLITQYNTESVEMKIASMKIASMKTAFDEFKHPRASGGEHGGEFVCKHCGTSGPKSKETEHAENHENNISTLKRLLDKETRPGEIKVLQQLIQKEGGDEPKRTTKQGRYGKEYHLSLLSAKLEVAKLRTAILQEQPDPSLVEGLKKTKDKQQSSSISGDVLEGKMVTGSMIDDYTNDSGRYVSYFLLRGDHKNLKEWGVTEQSIPHRIGSARGMPFVVTSNKFFPTSPYGPTTDHPSTEHFPKLGIAKAGSYNPNDMMLQAEFQEHFRVGSIVEVAKKGEDWIQVIKVDPKFKNHQMPPMISPAIFKLNPAEPDDKISTWTYMHSAGLDEKPAYGNMAIYRGSCDGPGSQCIKQLTAKMAGHKMVLPMCQKTQMIEMMELKIATMRVGLLTATMQSSDHENIKKLNVHKKMNFEEMKSLEEA